MFSLLYGNILLNPHVRKISNMNSLTFIYFAVLIWCSIGNAEDCKPSVSPPDPKSGCCGVTGPIDRIVPGLYTQLHDYPWMGIIEYKRGNETKLLCSAILISGRYMLSAAQCFGSRAIGTPVNVRLGEYDTSNDGPDCVEDGGFKECNDGALIVPIEKFIVHPEYDIEKKEHDIALIRLAKEVTSTEFIQPICLPSSDISLNPPNVLWSAGWGVIPDNATAPSNILHHVELPFVEIDTCQSAFNKLPNAHSIKLGNGQICAGGDGNDSCKGDSGGPLMFRGNPTEVAGIVSFGALPCGRIGVPGVYTKVFAYDAWIREHIEE